MHLRRVRPEDGVERFVTDCWRPYHEALTAAVDGHELAPGAETAAVVDHHEDLLSSATGRLWVAIEGGPEQSDSDAVEGGREAGTPLAELDAPLVGFVRTNLRPSPHRFDWPARLEVAALWVAPDHRGTGLAETLLDRARQQAREDGCADLTVDVARENERAVALAERAGFEPKGYRMHAPRDELALAPGDAPGLPDPGSGRHLRRLRADRAAVERFVDDCWLPFWRDLGDAVGEDHFDPALDRDRLVDELVESYDVADRRCWVVLDDPVDPDAPLETVDATVAGWLNAGHDHADALLASPPRLFVGNLYVAPDYRGSGLADRLLERAVAYAREEGCRELSLAVEAANGRARAFYDRVGFEPVRQRMAVSVEDLAV
jgi:ribosomal protein S18 acetylase RimI-like enzyme